MVFNSDVFLLAFLPIVFALFWIARTRQQRYVLLTLSGYVFYGYWNWKFCFLMLFSSLVSYFAALGISRTETARGKRAWVVASVSVDLTLLGFFKYYNFLAASLAALSSKIAPPLLDIVLPIGISFYTFHTISYIVDVAAGRVKAARNLFEYLTYVSLFSQLVAGPIVRYRQIEEDLEHIDGPPREDWIARGIGFFVMGMIRKVMLADQIAAQINPLIDGMAQLSTGAAWVAALGYTCQLYFDFSGYSDMAIGLGYLFGLRIPQNFNSPYKAAGIRDFWRRWHISLSTWLRDYLYIALGGSRGSALRTHINLLITMLLGGLWHGANWTFVIWGGYHGVLLILDRVLEPWWKAVPRPLYQLATFLAVVCGWVFFRAPSVGVAGEWFRRMAGAGNGATPAGPLAVLWVWFGLLAVIFLPESWDIRFGTQRRWAPVYAAGLFIAYLFMKQTKTVFLYYQF
ncbi:MAG: MBOAT family O-acyltransferase [Candidatus Solibacter sp.]